MISSASGLLGSWIILEHRATDVQTVKIVVATAQHPAPRGGASPDFIDTGSGESRSDADVRAPSSRPKASSQQYTRSAQSGGYNVTDNANSQDSQQRHPIIPGYDTYGNANPTPKARENIHSASPEYYTYSDRAAHPHSGGATLHGEDSLGYDTTDFGGYVTDNGYYTTGNNGYNTTDN